jgi:hypothetical protein
MAVGCGGCFEAVWHVLHSKIAKHFNLEFLNLESVQNGIVSSVSNNRFSNHFWFSIDFMIYGLND